MSPSSNVRTGVSYEATLTHLREVLRGFTPHYDVALLSHQTYRVRIPPGRLSVAVLAREVMVVFGAIYLGREDKVAWRYGFAVDGLPCVLASTKWGLRLELDVAVGDEDSAKHVAEHVIGKLAAAQHVVEKSVLSPQLADQIRAGNVTITNQYAAPVGNSMRPMGSATLCNVISGAPGS